MKARYFVYDDANYIDSAEFEDFAEAYDYAQDGLLVHIDIVRLGPDPMDRVAVWSYKDQRDRDVVIAEITDKYAELKEELLTEAPFQGYKLDDIYQNYRILLTGNKKSKEEIYNKWNTADKRAKTGSASAEYNEASIEGFNVRNRYKGQFDENEPLRTYSNGVLRSSHIEEIINERRNQKKTDKTVLKGHDIKGNTDGNGEKPGEEETGENKNKELIDLDAIVFNGDSVVYDKRTHSIYAENVPPTVRATYSGNDQVEIGRHEVTVTFTPKDKTKYRIDSDEATKTAILNIMAKDSNEDSSEGSDGNGGGTPTPPNPQPKPVPGLVDIDLNEIIFKDEVIIYDGKAHSLKATNVPNEVKVNYSDNNDQANVGEYEITAEFIVPKGINASGARKRVAKLTIIPKRADDIPDDDKVPVKGLPEDKYFVILGQLMEVVNGLVKKVGNTEITNIIGDNNDVTKEDITTAIDKSKTIGGDDNSTNTNNTDNSVHINKTTEVTYGDKNITIGVYKGKYVNANDVTQIIDINKLSPEDKVKAEQLRRRANYDLNPDDDYYVVLCNPSNTNVENRIKYLTNDKTGTTVFSLTDAQRRAATETNGKYGDIFAVVLHKLTEPTAAKRNDMDVVFVAQHGRVIRVRVSAKESWLQNHGLALVEDAKAGYKKLVLADCLNEAEEKTGVLEGAILGDNYNYFNAFN